MAPAKPAKSIHDACQANVGLPPPTDRDSRGVGHEDAEDSWCSRVHGGETFRRRGSEQPIRQTPYLRCQQPVGNPPLPY
jgi:hypothetical protein